MRKNRQDEGGRMERSDHLTGYVKENKDKLERVALYGKDVPSAMALSLLEKDEHGGE